MNRIVASVTRLEQHVDVLEYCPDVYRPPACPRCEIKRLWGHGYYYRKADRPASGEGTFNPVAICRYCCAHCRRTCSRLPLCIAPRRWYNWSVQQTVLAHRLSGESVGACARCAAVAGRTVGRWWGWLQDRSTQFEFGLRAREPELGRAVCQHQHIGIKIDARSAVTRWCGEALDYGIAIDGLMAQQARQRHVSAET